MCQDLTNVFVSGGEVHSYTFGLLIATSRNSFDYIQLNMSLTQTNSSFYYTNVTHTDVNCEIGKVYTFVFLFDNFVDTVIQLFKSKILYKEFPNLLCPLGIYNMSLAVFTQTNVHDTYVLYQFETSKYKVLFFLEII